MTAPDPPTSSPATRAELSGPRLRIGYLGPPGTFSEEAAMAALGSDADVEWVPLPDIRTVVMAVQDRHVERGLAPIENSLEGSVRPTLDTLAVAATAVVITSELAHPVRHCLVARPGTRFEDIRTVISHPQATSQCAEYLRAELPDASVHAAPSTAEAARLVADGGPAGTAAAIATALAARLYGCEVLREDIQDSSGNETRFVWLQRADAPREDPPAGASRWKTALVFWGDAADAPGWLVRCLSEFAFRGVNLVRIESRPRRDALGQYMFFVDAEGSLDDPSVAGAVAGLRTQAATVRVLGSFPSLP